MSSQVPVVVFLGLVLFAAFATVSWKIVSLQKEDVAASPLKSAVATISERRLVFHGQDRTRSYVTLTFDGYRYRFEYWVAYPNADRLSTAQTVSVKYRAGKSGQPYIEYLEPVSEGSTQ